eukprot:scaffold88735_cov28-Tisochrysis_lutea.AAC.13
MGAATDVDECVSESESAAERNECLLDYDMLVSGATPSLNSDGIIEVKWASLLGLRPQLICVSIDIS